MLLQDSHNILHFVQYVFAFGHNGQPYWCGGTPGMAPHEKETRLRFLSTTETPEKIHTVQCPRCHVVARIPGSSAKILYDD